MLAFVVGGSLIGVVLLVRWRTARELRGQGQPTDRVWRGLATNPLLWLGIIVVGFGASDLLGGIATVAALVATIGGAVRSAAALRRAG